MEWNYNIANSHSFGLAYLFIACFIIDVIFFSYMYIWSALLKNILGIIDDANMCSTIGTILYNLQIEIIQLGNMV